MPDYIGAHRSGNNEHPLHRLRPGGARFPGGAARATSRSILNPLVEHDALESGGIRGGRAGGPRPQRIGVRSSLAAVGLTNQRETTVLWDRLRGSRCQRLVWQDTRVDALARIRRGRGKDRLRAKPACRWRAISQA